MKHNRIAAFLSLILCIAMILPITPASAAETAKQEYAYHYQNDFYEVYDWEINGKQYHLETLSNDNEDKLVEFVKKYNDPKKMAEAYLKKLDGYHVQIAKINENKPTNKNIKLCIEYYQVYQWINIGNPFYGNLLAGYYAKTHANAKEIDVCEAANILGKYCPGKYRHDNTPAEHFKACRIRNSVLTESYYQLDENTRTYVPGLMEEAADFDSLRLNIKASQEKNNKRIQKDMEVWSEAKGYLPLGFEKTYNPYTKQRVSSYLNTNYKQVKVGQSFTLKIKGEGVTQQNLKDGYKVVWKVCHYDDIATLNAEMQKNALDTLYESKYDITYTGARAASDPGSDATSWSGDRVKLTPSKDGLSCKVTVLSNSIFYVQPYFVKPGGDTEEYNRDDYLRQTANWLKDGSMVETYWMTDPCLVMATATPCFQTYGEYLKPGSTFQLTVNNVTAATAKKITYKSSDTKTATVDKTGLVTTARVDKGVADITAWLDGTYLCTTTIVVTPSVTCETKPEYSEKKLDASDLIRWVDAPRYWSYGHRANSDGSFNVWSNIEFPINSGGRDSITTATGQHNYRMIHEIYLHKISNTMDKLKLYNK